MTTREQLEEQYEDAYFALLMHKIAEQDGARLEHLNEELQNDPAAAVPEEIDRKCLKTIDRYFAQKRHAGYWRTSKKILGRVGIVAAIVMLLFTTAFALSEEFRVTTLNLLITIEEKYTELHMEETEDPTADSACPGPLHSAPQSADERSCSSAGGTGRIPPPGNAGNSAC